MALMIGRTTIGTSGHELATSDAQPPSRYSMSCVIEVVYQASPMFGYVHR